MAWRMMRRDYRPHPRMLFVRAKELRIEAPDGIAAQADGELLAQPILSAVVAPHAARFIVPRRTFSAR
jgi:diacylglycerol kinase family enzyme